MKKLLPIFLLFQMHVYAQSIQNGNFESWNTMPYNEPTGWVTSNIETISQYGLITVDKVSGFSGNAIKLITQTDGIDTIGAYFTNSPGDPTSGEGGFPYSQQPTHFTGYYKYNLPGSDTALMLVIFKKDGDIISEDWFKIRGTGQQNTFTQFSLPLNLSSTPDSVIIAATSSNLMTEEGIMPGSSLELDELAFTGNGATQSIAFGNFDTWTATSYDQLIDWEPSGQGVSRTTDKYKGTYALQLQTIDYGNGDIYSSGVSTQEGGTPFTNQVDTLIGYYKYSTASDDSAVIYISTLNDTDYVGFTNLKLAPANNYTYFEIPVISFMAPNTIQIVIQSSDWNQNASPSSILIIDEVQLKSQPLTTGIKLLHSDKISNAFPVPANNQITINLNKAIKSNTTIAIIDITGKTIFETELSNNTITINTSEYSSGVYFYEIKNMEGIITRNKFIKQ